MRHKIISVSQAKSRFLELVRQVETEGKAFLLTKDGDPVGVLVPLEDYEALLETVDVLADEQTLRDLEEALEDERKGRLWQRDEKGHWKKRERRRKGKKRRVTKRKAA